MNFRWHLSGTIWLCYNVSFQYFQKAKETPTDSNEAEAEAEAETSLDALAVDSDTAKAEPETLVELDTPHEQEAWPEATPSNQEHFVYVSTLDPGAEPELESVCGHPGHLYKIKCII